MPITVPPAVSAPALGNVKIAAAVTIANTAAPDLSTELEASTTVDLSCALMSDGWKPSGDQSKLTKRRRKCSKSDIEILGPTTYKLEKLMYSIGDPQDPDTETTGLMVEGARVYLVERRGPDADDAFAVGDKVRTHYVILGAPIEMESDGDNGEFYVEQALVYVNESGPVAGTVVA